MTRPDWLNEYPRLAEVYDAWVARDLVSIEDFNAMTDEMRAKSFAAVVTMNDTQRQALLDGIGKAISEGMTVKEFRDFAGPMLENPAYADLVYRQNTTNAFTGGQYKDMFGELGSDYPCWRFNAVLDNRNDEESECPNLLCRELDGKVFPKDNAAMRHLLPPVHFQCRCITEEISEEEAARLTVATSFHLHPAEGFDFDKLNLVPGGL